MQSPNSSSARRFSSGFVAALVGLAIALGACGVDPQSTGTPDSAIDTTGDGGTPDAGTSTCATAPTYANFGQAFFTSYCTRCHSGYRNLSSITRDKIKIFNDAAADDTAVRTRMPRGGGARPTVEERTQLGLFLNCL